MYVTPIAHDEVCVAFVTHDLRLRFDAALPQFANLAERLAEVDIVGQTRGAVTPSRRLRRVQSGRIALVGEAAGSVDAITGEGLSIAFRQALAIAAAIRANRLDQYQTAHQHIMRAPRHMAQLLLALDRRRQLRRRVLRALERQNDVFERMLAVHTGSCSMRQFGLGRAVAFGVESDPCLGWQEGSHEASGVISTAVACASFGCGFRRTGPLHVGRGTTIGNQA